MSENQQHENWEQAVQQAIRSLRFGSVVVVVHEGKVTQIEKREKIRPALRQAQGPESVAAHRSLKTSGDMSYPSPTHNGRPE